MKNVGLELDTIETPDRFWAEFGSGISVGVQAGSPILDLYQMKNERNCRSDIVSAHPEYHPKDRLSAL